MRSGVVASVLSIWLQRLHTVDLALQGIEQFLRLGMVHPDSLLHLSAGIARRRHLMLQLVRLVQELITRPLALLERGSIRVRHLRLAILVSPAPLAQARVPSPILDNLEPVLDTRYAVPTQRLEVFHICRFVEASGAGRSVRLRPTSAVKLRRVPLHFLLQMARYWGLSLVNALLLRSLDSILASVRHERLLGRTRKAFAYVHLGRGWYQRLAAAHLFQLLGVLATIHLMNLIDRVYYSNIEYQISEVS